ncbi:hypothetical protein [Streptomyces sp. NPDC014894]|uniref:hypothetical protein n=1 Tax=unclassified Streptomyces TaxID=2593676 RepID=UPI0037034FA6
MQRKAYTPRREASRDRTALRPRATVALVPVLVAGLVAALVTGCTADSGAEGAADAKTGDGTTAAVQPGKYRTLLEPCGSIGRSTLRDLLPGTAELPQEQQKKALRGIATSTFDTDRRVGCGWRADSPDASHTLSLDFERVVSYDPAVSDNDRAQEVFAKKAGAVPLPIAAPSESAEGTTAGESARTSPSSPSSPGPDASSSPAEEGGESPGTEGADGAGGTPESGDTEPAEESEESEENLDPRILDDLGDIAFLNDVLTPAGAGSTAQRRTVSVAFRTSNVIVTVVYTEQSGRITSVPDSKELQDKARSLAGNLAGKFGG